MRDSFAQDIEEQAGDEPILRVIIGKIGHDWDGEIAPDEKCLPLTRLGIPITWKTARPLLDYRYDDGFGGSDCHPIWAYTKNRLIYVSEYDGSTTVRWMPRYPAPGKPDFS